MGQKRDEQRDESIGITNRGLEQERSGQEYVMDSTEGMEADRKRDDLNTGDRLMDDGTQMRRNLEPTVGNEDGLTLTPDRPSGEGQIDSRKGNQDDSQN